MLVRLLLITALVLGWGMAADTATALEKGASGGASGGVSGGTLEIGSGPQSESLDPHRSTTVTDSRVLQELFLGLTTRDRAGHTVPGAAERWEVSADGLTWTFHLRSDGRWSDGSPVTADDFVFAWRRALAPTTRALFADILYPVRNARAVSQGGLPPEALAVEAVDARTLRVVLEQPKANFADYLYHRTTYPLHRGNLERDGAEWVRPGRLIGNGPYLLVDALVNSHIRLVRNPHFFDPPAIGTVTFHVTEDQQTELRRYQAGELDVTYTFPPAMVDVLRTEMKEHLRQAPLGASLFLAPNLRVEPWKSNGAFRRALSLAIDRETLASRVVQTVKPSFGLVPAGVGGYRPRPPAWARWSQAQRELEARRLLQEAGFGPGKPPPVVEILYPSGERNRQIAIAIAAMWKQVLDVEASLVNQEQRVVLARQRAFDYPGVVLRAWQWAFPEKYLELLRSGEANGNGYANPAFDAALDAANATVDGRAFLDALARAEALALQDDPVIPLTSGASGRLVHPDLEGWEDNLVDSHMVRWLSWRAGSRRAARGG